MRAPIEERFWKKVEKSDGCWTWTAAVDSKGYGVFWNGRVIAAHRFAFGFMVGPITDGLFVLHRCDNPKCVRPDHLFLGTHNENMRDMAEKGRARGPGSGRTFVPVTRCRNGHEYDEQNTYITPSGGRMCRPCNRAAQRRMAERRRAA